MKRTLVFVAAGMLITGSGLAQQTGPMLGLHMKGKDTKMMMLGAIDTPSTKAFEMAMMPAMQMMPTISGEADADLMKHMRHHHQAAIEMAEVVVANGKDADVKN